MKNILVPTDFSTCADNALNFAVESAKLFPLQIRYFMRWNYPGTLYDYVGLNKNHQSLLHEATVRLRS